MPSQEANAVTAAYQRQQQALTVDIVRQVSTAWHAVDPTDVDKAWPLVSRTLAHVVERGYAASTAQAVAYLRAHAGASDVDLADLRTAQPLDLEQIDTALRVTGPVAVKRAAAAGRGPEQAARAAVVQLSGAASRLSLIGGRSTIAGTVEGSDQIVGWRRVIGAHACYFCAMLASRGAVYKDEHRATFKGSSGHKYHDHCHCLPEPLYAHEDEPPEIRALYEQFREATGSASGKDAVAAFRRAYDPATAARVVEARVTPIAARDLSTLGDAELSGLLSAATTEADVERVLAELDHRDEVARAEQAAEAKRAQAKERRDARKLADQQAKDARFDELTAAGMDPESAYAEVFGVAIEQQRRTEAIRLLRGNGYQGSNFDQLSRAAYREEVDRLYVVAEERTNGFMLNAAGQRAGVDPRTLFTGNENTARKYASDELLQFWADHGRLTLEDFRAGLLGGRMRERTVGDAWR